MRLPVSGCICKELESHHFHPQKKEAFQQKKKLKNSNQQLSLEPSESWGYKVNHSPKSWETSVYRELHFPGSRNCTLEPALGNSLRVID